MRVVLQCLVVVEDVHGAITSLTTAVKIGSHLLVEHEVPHENGLTPLVNGAEGDVLYVGREALGQVTTVVPCTDTAFGEDKFLVGSLIVNVGQLVVGAAVVVVRGADYQLRTLEFLAQGIINLHGVVVLILVVVRSEE